MNAAISGLTAQSNAFGNISDNVANSQTIGFKRVDTAFIDYLTVSTAEMNVPGSVVARPQYVNNVQGSLTQTQNPLGMAIAGQGFFVVSQQTGEANGLPVFATQQYYTRAGDFQMDADGYLVNSAGKFLNGWLVDSTTGILNQSTVAPIRFTATAYAPVATTAASLVANLPATPAPATPITTQILVYDALGTAHTVTLDWTQNAANDWTVSVTSADDVSSPARGTADILFGPIVSGNPVPDGAIGDINATTGSIASAGYSAGGAAALSFTTDFGSGPQTITLSLGTFGQTGGLTQFAGSAFNLQSLTQNGVPPGTFSGLTARPNGDIVASYDNGQSQLIARVPLVTFSNPNALQREDGQAFTETVDSGTALITQVAANGAGNLVTNALENSNVDIAEEFSKLIVAQRAYAANTRMITTADDMLQQTIDMKR
jgi:flagellar hook protein FlgE